MTKLAFLSLAVLTFGAFAAEPKIPAESQAVLFLDLAKSLALPAFKDVAVPDEPFAPGMPKLKDVKWALLTADKVVIPPPNAKSYALPSLALAVSGTFDAKAALEASVKSEGPDGIKLTPLAGLPFPAWSIPVDQLPAAAEQEELKKITNLKPCVGAVAKDVVVLAVNPETLKAQGSLFGGKVTGGDFKKAMPACCLGLKVSGVDALIAAGEAEAKKVGLVSLGGHRSVGGFRASIYNAMPVEGVAGEAEAKKAGKPADPTSELFKGLKVVRFTVDAGEGATLKLKLAGACKDDQSAQGLETGLGMFTMLVKEAVKGLKVSRKGKIVSVSGEVNPQELIGMVQMSMMGGQGMMATPPAAAAE